MQTNQDLPKLEFLKSKPELKVKPTNSLNELIPSNVLFPFKPTVNDHPAFSGPLKQEAAEKLLHKHPISSWMIRYSVREKGVVVTLKTGENTYKTFKKIEICQPERSLSNLPLHVIIHTFGRAKLVYPQGFCIPDMPFLPLFKFAFVSQMVFKKFQEQWNQSKIDKQFKIVFHQESQSIFVPYTGNELIALTVKYSFLQSYFGDRRHNIFNGYSTDDDNVNPIKLEDVQNLKALLIKANHFFNHFVPANIKVEVPAFTTPLELITDILNLDFSGLLIGESHIHLQSKKVLIDNFHIFKSLGVETLFLEFLCYDVIQNDLDAYHSSSFQQIPVIIESYLDSLDFDFDLKSHQGYKALVVAAKKAGIRVVGIDSSASAIAGYNKSIGSEGPERIKALNYQAQEIMNKEISQKKFIALMGNSHVSTTYRIPGLSEILGCPNIVILDSNDSNVIIERQVDNFLPQAFDYMTSQDLEKKGGKIHFLVKIPSQSRVLNQDIV